MHQNRKFVKNLTSGCNAECDCDSSLYSPVCAFENTTFYSPCYAGCKTSDGLGSQAVDHLIIKIKLWNFLDSFQFLQNYFDCACIGGANVTNAACSPQNCELMFVFLAFFGFLVLTEFMTAIPIQQAELRY